MSGFYIAKVRVPQTFRRTAEKLTLGAFLEVALAPNGAGATFFPLLGGYH